VSNESVDRDGDIVLVAAFKRRLGIYRSHPVLLASHRHLDLQAQIGEAYDVKAVEDGLRAKFKYYVGEGNDEADWAFKLAAKGKAAYSIGFIPHAYEDLKPSATNKGARRRFTDIELVEISQVCVPSNRDALVACYEEAEEPDRELADIALKMFEAEEKGAIPYSVHGDTAKAPEDAEWDAGTEVAKADVAQLKKMCAWFDSTAPDNKTSYKLPHHRADGNTVVWRAVRAAMGALLGARGGADIPTSDKAGVHAHLAKHYKQFAKEVPPLKSYSEQELEALFIEKPAPDVTENYIRIRVRDPGDFREDSFRTVWISRAQGINSVQGKRKSPPQGHEGAMVVQSFLFMKDG